MLTRDQLGENTFVWWEAKSENGIRSCPVYITGIDIVGVIITFLDTFETGWILGKHLEHALVEMDTCSADQAMQYMDKQISSEQERLADNPEELQKYMSRAQDFADLFK